ncbi:MAG: hypothetical protein U0263_22065 [Polyangiaceae bacterium]
MLADTQADYGGPIYEAMYRAIKTNFMPYCAEGTSCAGTVKDGLGPVIPLSEEQKKTMLDWLGACVHLSLAGVNTGKIPAVRTGNARLPRSVDI